MRILGAGSWRVPGLVVIAPPAPAEEGAVRPVGQPLSRALV